MPHALAMSVMRITTIRARERASLPGGADAPVEREGLIVGVADDCGRRVGVGARPRRESGICIDARVIPRLQRGQALGIRNAVLLQLLDEREADVDRLAELVRCARAEVRP